MEEKILQLEARIRELEYYQDTTIGLWCIDRNPKEVTKEWIEENAFQLTAPSGKDSGL